MVLPAPSSVPLPLHLAQSGRHPLIPKRINLGQGQLTVFCGWPNHINAELREYHILTEAKVKETEFIRAFGDSDVL